MLHNRNINKLLRYKINNKNCINNSNNSSINNNFSFIKFYSKSRNIFDDDDDEEQEVVIDQAKRDQEYREMRNQPYKGTYHRTIIENLKGAPVTPGKRKQIEPVEFTDEEIDQIIQHEMKQENQNQRNFFNEDIQVEEVSSIKPIQLPNKDVIEDDKFSYKDLNDAGFELLLKEIFKNKRTGECDLDEEDLKEIKKMLLVTDNFQLNILNHNELNNNNKNNNNNYNNNNNNNNNSNSNSNSSNNN